MWHLRQGRRVALACRSMCCKVEEGQSSYSTVVARHVATHQHTAQPHHQKRLGSSPQPRDPGVIFLHRPQRGRVRLWRRGAQWPRPASGASRAALWLEALQHTHPRQGVQDPPRKVMRASMATGVLLSDLRRSQHRKLQVLPLWQQAPHKGPVAVQRAASAANFVADVLAASRHARSLRKDRLSAARALPRTRRKPRARRRYCQRHRAVGAAQGPVLPPDIWQVCVLFSFELFVAPGRDFLWQQLVRQSTAESRHAGCSPPSYFWRPQQRAPWPWLWRSLCSRSLWSVLLDSCRIATMQGRLAAALRERLAAAVDEGGGALKGGWQLL